MVIGRVATRVGSAVACAALSLSLLSSGAAAQSYGPSGGQSSGPASSQTSSGNTGSSPVVRVESNISPNGVAGNLSLNGVAVDCATGRPATRVAVYDGENGPYIADVSMDTVKSTTRYCSGQFGNAQIGWSLIFDTRNLNNGRHNLAFTAEFPGGAKATTVATVYFDNNTFTVDNDQYFYGSYYNRGYGYGGYGYGGYGYGGGYGINYPLGYGNYYGGYNGFYTAGLAANYPGYGTPFYGYGSSIYRNPYVGYVNPFSYYGYYTPGLGNPIIGNPGNGGFYGSYSIILNQAGQSVARNSLSVLSGIVSCSLGGTSTVTVSDVSAGGSVIGSAPAGGAYSVTWNTNGLTGGHLIRVTATGPCGTQSQTFSVVVV